MIHRNIIQGSPEWFDIKRGKLTATHVKDILPSKKGYKEARYKLMKVLAREIITGVTVHKRSSKAMEDGLLKEPEARAIYEALTGSLVEEIGFIDHPTIKGFGSSPDGIVSKYKGMEIKSPEPEAHFDIVIGGKSAIKKEYIIQMNVNMVCHGCELWDYVDYDPTLEGDKSLIIIPVEKDEVLCAEIELEAKLFINELNQMVEMLRSIK